MPFLKDLRELSTTVALSTASVTATGTGTSIDLQNYTGEGQFILNIGAATAGTAPTMDIAVNDSADNSSFAAISTPIAATQVTTVAGVQVLTIDTRAMRRYVRLALTIGGSASPAFPCSAVFVGTQQNQ